MSRTAPSPYPGVEEDRAYPTSSPVDPVFPCRTLRPLCPLFEGVATPGIWSRLEGPLGTALEGLWRVAGLGTRLRPLLWTSLHYGRIALNAHSWELLWASLRGERPDASLIPPPEGRLAEFVERASHLPAPWRSRRLQSRARRGLRAANASLHAAADLRAEELDLAHLARGPLDELTWTRLILAWLGEQLLERGGGAAEPETARAVDLERLFARALGERLVERGVLQRPAEVAYLTVEERIAAVNDPAGPWSIHLPTRIKRVQEFLELEVPDVFWGPPRVTPAQTR
jgi:hypothetical protein